MTEKTSVIIITRNRENMLIGCLESLVKQTRKPNEVIIVDNASTDKTREVIFYFKKKLPIRYFLEKQIGIPYARNRGIREASGTILLMLDDDCIADKFWIERMIGAHIKYPSTWAIQGRTNSLPKTQMHSLVSEFNRLISIRNYAKKNLSLRNVFSKGFDAEVEIITCNTQNFSIKTYYVKKYKLSFDENFYRGSDTDLGRQIVQKNGSILFCSRVQVAHLERSSFVKFLEQRWHIGRTAARIEDKWKTPSLTTYISLLWPKKFFIFFLFCKISNHLSKLPILLVLLFLDRLYYLNGWFYEKRILVLAKRV